MNERRGGYHDIKDLLAMKFPGDDKLAHFKESFDNILASLNNEQPKETLEAILYNLISGSKTMSDEISRYNTAEDGDSEKSYEYLYRTLEKTVLRQQRDGNRDAVTKAIAGGIAVPATGSQQSTKDTKKAKQKAKKEEKKRQKDAEEAAKKMIGGGKGDKSGSGYATPGGVVCKYWLNGYCKKGNACNMMHSKGQGKGKAKGKGKGGKSGYSSGSRTPKGKGKGKGKGWQGSWWKGGKSGKGSGYATPGNNDTDKGDGKGKKQGKSDGEKCPFHLRGECKLGDDCWMPHTPCMSFFPFFGTPAQMAIQEKWDKYPCIRPVYENENDRLYMVIPIANYYNNIHVQFFDDKDEKISERQVRGAQRFVTLPSNDKEDWKKVKKIKTFTGRGIIREIRIVHGRKPATDAERKVWFNEDAEVFEVEVPDYEAWRKVQKQVRDKNYNHASQNPQMIHNKNVAKKRALRTAQALEESVKKEMQEDNIATSVPGCDPFDPSEWWIWDTGAGNFLIGEQDMSEAEMKAKYKIDDPCTLSTANNIVTVDERVEVQIPRLKLIIDPLVMEKSPKVLPTGRMCAEYGYGFYWEPWASKPSVYDPNQRPIDIMVHHYVPLMKETKDHGTTSFATPSTNYASRLQVKRIYEDSVLPCKATEASAGWDLQAYADAWIKAGEQCVVNTGISALPPPGTYLRIAPRSGFFTKHNLTTVLVQV